MNDSARIKKAGEAPLVFLAGAGFLADAYDLFVIDLVLAVLDHSAPSAVGETGAGASSAPASANAKGPPISAREKGLIASASIFSAIFGQLAFGFLADWFGRKILFVTTCVLIVIGCAGQAVAPSAAAGGVFLQLLLFRIVLGVGIGGEYPLAAAVTCEKAPVAERKTTLATVFSMQGWGQLLSVVVVFLLLKVPAEGGNYLSLDLCWRLAILAGGVPTAVVCYFRMRMAETEAFQKSRGVQLEDDEQRSLVEKSPKSPRASAVLELAVVRDSGLGATLVGTAFSWFLLDVTFYGMALYKAEIGKQVFPDTETTARAELHTLTLQAGLIVLIGLPGYLLSIAVVDRVGLRKLQILGFVAIGLLFTAASALVHFQLAPTAVLILIGGTMFFSNFGPNATTYILPAIVYPTPVRATCHGLSAAMGKAGAALGVFTFGPLLDEYGFGVVLKSCAEVAFLGAVVTWYFIPESVDEVEDSGRSTSLTPEQAETSFYAADHAGERAATSGKDGKRTTPLVERKAVSPSASPLINA
eukprot:g4220.t1